MEMENSFWTLVIVIVATMGNSRDFAGTSLNLGAGQPSGFEQDGLFYGDWPLNCSCSRLGRK